MNQMTWTARDFANRFEQVAREALVDVEAAKGLLLSALNEDTRRVLEARLGSHLQLKLGLPAMAMLTQS